jgi:hypothetical protein
MIKFILMTLRPTGRFLAQCISTSTQPSAFVRESIRLGDTTNFLRAANFFLSAISTAFLAEVATLYLLGIGSLTEPLYWLFILLTSIPFVLFCFLLLRFVAPFSLRDVLHVSFYPIGTGIFVGALIALVASTVVASLVAIGFIPEIKYDFSQWGEDEENVHGLVMAVRDCLKGESLVYTVVATGLQEAYSNLRPPIDAISYIRPLIAVFYLVMAASAFTAIVEQRKRVVFCTVLLAALVSTGVNIVALKAYLQWNPDNSVCQEQLAKWQIGVDRLSESALKQMAVDLNSSAKANNLWESAYRADGRTLRCTYRLKSEIDPDSLTALIKQQQKYFLDVYCSHRGRWLRAVKATESHTYYSVKGERLTSFSIGPPDCQQW